MCNLHKIAQSVDGDPPIQVTQILFEGCLLIWIGIGRHIFPVNTVLSIGSDRAPGGPKGPTNPAVKNSRTSAQNECTWTLSSFYLESRADKKKKFVSRLGVNAIAIHFKIIRQFVIVSHLTVETRQQNRPRHLKRQWDEGPPTA